MKVEKEQKSGLVNYYENIKKLKYILSPSFNINNINYIKPIYFNYQIPRSGDAQMFFQSYKYIRPPLLHDLNNIFCCLTYLWFVMDLPLQCNKESLKISEILDTPISCPFFYYKITIVNSHTIGKSFNLVQFERN